MSAPSQRIWPEVAGSRPASIFTVVDLPLPLGPEVPGHLARRDGERHVIDYGAIAILLREPADVQHRVPPRRKVRHRNCRFVPGPVYAYSALSASIARSN